MRDGERWRETYSLPVNPAISSFYRTVTKVADKDVNIRDKRRYLHQTTREKTQAKRIKLDINTKLNETLNRPEIQS
jgi:hypothetical protein